MSQNGIGILLSVIASISLILICLVPDSVSLLLCETDHLLITGQNHCLLLCISNDGLGLCTCPIERLVLFLDNATSGCKLLREDTANLVQKLVEILGINNLLLSAVHKGRFCLTDKLLKLRYEALDFFTWLHPGLLSYIYKTSYIMMITLMYIMRLL